MGRVGGIIFAALIVLGTIWAYNHFSDTGISTLGAKKAT